ncbi:hypothetical protein VTL71DRAFT_13486 [Oculimacula yallundae]|uniref:Uncharacterized protein n=1 Tax=Oculimacula yallundae TaxID=86028 RepID=A0ABR4CKH9_9HELO
MRLPGSREKAQQNRHVTVIDQIFYPCISQLKVFQSLSCPSPELFTNILGICLVQSTHQRRLPFPCQVDQITPLKNNTFVT